MKLPHITVVIPTRERSETLGDAIRSCLSQDYDDFSVVVSDNLSLDATPEVVRSFNDSRLHYVNPGRRLSMSSHFNFALATLEVDGLVTSIGDDDALLPGALRYAATVASDHPGLPIACGSVYYGWPNLSGLTIANRLVIGGSGDEVIVREAREIVHRRITFNEYQEGYVWGLAGIYRGFVPLQVLRAGVKNGSYIHSVTPDAYSAFLTTLMAGRYVFVTRPLFVEGVSAKSNGAAQSLLRDDSEEKRYLEENDFEIHPRLVYCPAPSFVMIEAFLRVKENFPELARGLEPDIARMCMSAELEMRDDRLVGVRAAVKVVLARNQVRKSNRLAYLVARGRRRLHSVRSAFSNIDVDGRTLGIKDVYAASIVAGALWSDGAGVGIVKGWRLFLRRLAAFTRSEDQRQTSSP